MKAALTSLYLGHISSDAKSLCFFYESFINRCLAVLCKFFGDFWAFWDRDIFSQRID